MHYIKGLDFFSLIHLWRKPACIINSICNFISLEHIKIFIWQNTTQGCFVRKMKAICAGVPGSYLFPLFCPAELHCFVLFHFQPKSNFVNGTLRCSDEVIADKGIETTMLQ